DPPVLDSVTALVELVLTRWSPNDREVGETEPEAGATPVPLRPTPCGLPAALSATLRVPLRAPAAVGLNVTLMAQLALAARVDGLKGQLLVWENGRASCRERVGLAVGNAELQVKVSVTVGAALVVFTGWLLFYFEEEAA